MRKQVLGIIALGLLAFIVAGCSGSPDKASPAASAGKPAVKILEACDIITKAEAEQFIGEAVKEAEKKETPQVGLKLCVYNSAKSESNKFLQVGITQESFMPSSGQSPKSIYSSIKNNFPNAVKVDGVGDEAFIAPPGLHILSGTYYVTIAVGNSNDPKNREILKIAGQKAVDKLPKGK